MVCQWRRVQARVRPRDANGTAIPENQALNRRVAIKPEKIEKT
jgi:hypothetical protein